MKKVPGLMAAAGKSKSDVGQGRQGGPEQLQHHYQQQSSSPSSPSFSGLKKSASKLKIWSSFSAGQANDLGGGGGKHGGSHTLPSPISIISIAMRHQMNLLARPTSWSRNASPLHSPASVHGSMEIDISGSSSSGGGASSPHTTSRLFAFAGLPSPLGRGASWSSASSSPRAGGGRGQQQHSFNNNIHSLPSPPTRTSTITIESSSLASPSSSPILPEADAPAGKPSHRLEVVVPPLPLLPLQAPSALSSSSASPPLSPATVASPSRRRPTLRVEGTRGVEGSPRVAIPASALIVEDDEENAEPKATSSKKKQEILPSNIGLTEKDIWGNDDRDGEGKKAKKAEGREGNPSPAPIGFSREGSVRLGGFDIGVGGLTEVPSQLLSPGRPSSAASSMSAASNTNNNGGIESPDHLLFSSDTSIASVGSPSSKRRMSLNADDGSNQLVVIGRLGKGNGGTVMKALYLPTMKLVALKIVPMYNAERRQQMVQELSMLYSNLADIDWDPCSAGFDSLPSCDENNNNNLLLGMYDNNGMDDDGREPRRRRRRQSSTGSDSSHSISSTIKQDPSQTAETPRARGGGRMPSFSASTAHERRDSLASSSGSGGSNMSADMAFIEDIPMPGVLLGEFPGGEGEGDDELDGSRSSNISDSNGSNTGAAMNQIALPSILMEEEQEENDTAARPSSLSSSAVAVAVAAVGPFPPSPPRRPPPLSQLRSPKQVDAEEMFCRMAATRGEGLGNTHIFTSTLTLAGGKRSSIITSAVKQRPSYEIGLAGGGERNRGSSTVTDPSTVVSPTPTLGNSTTTTQPFSAAALAPTPEQPQATSISSSTDSQPFSAATLAPPMHEQQPASISSSSNTQPPSAVASSTSLAAVPEQQSTTITSISNDINAAVVAGAEEEKEKEEEEEASFSPVVQEEEKKEAESPSFSLPPAVPPQRTRRITFEPNTADDEAEEKPKKEASSSSSSTTSATSSSNSPIKRSSSSSSSSSSSGSKKADSNNRKGSAGFDAFELRRGMAVRGAGATLRQAIGEEETTRGATHCPFIVSFYDVFSDPTRGMVNLVVEYMDGGSLEDLVHAGGCANEEVLAHIAASVLQGLSFLHERKKIHRDVKPGNLLMNSRGFVKIADFGVSRNLSGTVDLSKTFVGTVGYMSPERIQGSKYNTKADIWSVGLSIMACAVGAFPYESQVSSTSYFELVNAVCDEPSPTLPLTFSPQFRDFVALCLLKDPAERPSAETLLFHPFLRKAVTPGQGPTAVAANNRIHANAIGYEKAMQVKEAELVQVIDALAMHFDKRKSRGASGSISLVNAAPLPLLPLQQFQLPIITSQQIQKLAEAVGLTQGVVKDALVYRLQGFVIFPDQTLIAEEHQNISTKIGHSSSHESTTAAAMLKREESSESFMTDDSRSQHHVHPSSTSAVEAPPVAKDLDQVPPTPSICLIKSLSISVSGPRPRLHKIDSDEELLTKEGEEESDADDDDSEGSMVDDAIPIVMDDVDFQHEVVASMVNIPLGPVSTGKMKQQRQQEGREGEIVEGAGQVVDGGQQQKPPSQICCGIM